MESEQRQDRELEPVTAGAGADQGNRKVEERLERLERLIVERLALIENRMEAVASSTARRIDDRFSITLFNCVDVNLSTIKDVYKIALDRSRRALANRRRRSSKLGLNVDVAILLGNFTTAITVCRSRRSMLNRSAPRRSK